MFKVFACLGVVRMYLKKVNKKIAQLAAKRGQHQAALMSEKLTPPKMGSLAKAGRTQSLMNMISPLWEITTSVGILVGLPNPKYGATPLHYAANHASQ